LLAATTRRNLAELAYLTHQENFLRGKDRVLSEATSEIKGIISDQPYYDQMVKRLEEKVDEKKREYRNWQDEAQRQKIGRATKEAQAETKYTILEPATIPLTPSSPERKKIGAIGLLLGLFIGVSAVVLIEMNDQSVTTIEDIERLLGLEVVGTIPNLTDVPRTKGTKAA
jgi:capsular polysaccharide biosynthesis protein